MQSKKQVTRRINNDREYFKKVNKIYKKDLKALWNGCDKEDDVATHNDIFTKALVDYTKPMLDCISNFVASGVFPTRCDSEFEGFIRDAESHLGEILSETRSPITELASSFQEIMDEYSNIVKGVPDLMISTPIAFWEDLTDGQKRLVVSSLVANGKDIHSDEFHSLMVQFRETGLPRNHVPPELL